MISETKIIKLRDSETLNAQVIENGSPVWLVITHGLGEHGMRHSHFMEHYSQYFNILIYDLRGHGKSSGAKGNIGKFSEFSDDLLEVIDYLVDEFKMERYVLFGHSMGALITSSFMQSISDTTIYPEKVILSSPPVSASGIFGKVFNMSPMSLTRLLANLPVSIPISGILDLKKLSHDILTYEDYRKDPLNTLSVHTHLFFELIQHAREVFSRPLHVKCDLQVIIGSEDALVGAPECIDYFKNIEKNANLVVIEGGYHELHNEVDKYNAPYSAFIRKALLADSE